MLARAKRTLSGNSEIIEGYILIADDGTKLIANKNEDVEDWGSCIASFDEGTEEYFISGKWVNEDFLTKAVQAVQAVHVALGESDVQ